MRTTYKPPLLGHLTRGKAGCLQLIKFLIIQHSESLVLLLFQVQIFCSAPSSSNTIHILWQKRRQL